MRFILSLLLAMSTAITWHSTVMAGVSSQHDQACAAEGEKKDKKDKKKGSSDEEPECE